MLEAATGAFAEYVSIPEDFPIALKLNNMTFEQAASVLVAGIVALQALRDHAHVAPGDKVLINARREAWARFPNSSLL